MFKGEQTDGCGSNEVRESHCEGFEQKSEEWHDQMVFERIALDAFLRIYCGGASYGEVGSWVRRAIKTNFLKRDVENDNLAVYLVRKQEMLQGTLMAFWVAEFYISELQTCTNIFLESYSLSSNSKKKIDVYIKHLGCFQC